MFPRRHFLDRKAGELHLQRTIFKTYFMLFPVVTSVLALPPQPLHTGAPQQYFFLRLERLAIVSIVTGSLLWLL